MSQARPCSSALLSLLLCARASGQGQARSEGGDRADLLEVARIGKGGV